MEKLDGYVGKQTYKKLQLAGINNWEQLFKIHWNQKEEFWDKFSKTITEAERLKLERVLYRECIWDNDKFYYHNDECLNLDGTCNPRTNDGNNFELIKFEKEETSGNLRYNRDDFIREKIVIDRLNRTIERKIQLVRKNEIEIKTKLDYYALNIIFA